MTAPEHICIYVLARRDLFPWCDRELTILNDETDLATLHSMSTLFTMPHARFFARITSVAKRSPPTTLHSEMSF